MFNLIFNQTNASPFSYELDSGSVLFVIGPNGSGKSTLMQHFANSNDRRSRRVTAHRQVWFNSDAVDITAASRSQMETNFYNVDRQEPSRYQDVFGSQRTQVAIFDLIDLDNINSREIAKAFRDDDNARLNELKKEKSPISKVNDILSLANLDFYISLSNGNKLVANREGFAPYGVDKLSDGERNALLIIANVLTAPENFLILIDEPERHLHRSIVSPLISTLLTYRSDCAFVVSTHDVSIPLDHKGSSVLLIRDCEQINKSWTVNFISSVQEIDEEVSNAILGSRTVMLFVEGSNTSLDLMLYQILFPNVTIKSYGSCVDVERIVTGINQSSQSHWIKAYGIIDKDNRSQANCDLLATKGIITLDQYSVESLYYHPEVIKAILMRVSSVNEINVDAVMTTMTNEIIREVTKHKAAMAARLIERAVRDKAYEACPNWEEILKGNVEISFSSEQLYLEEVAKIEEMIDQNDIKSLICRYPLRHTGVFTYIAKSAQFSSREKYEMAVRKMLKESNADLEMFKNIIKPVVDFIV